MDRTLALILAIVVADMLPAANAVEPTFRQQASIESLIRELRRSDFVTELGRQRIAFADIRWRPDPEFIQPAKRQAIRELVARGQEAAPYLAKHVFDGNHELFLSIADVLKAIGEPACPALLPLLKDPDEWRRVKAVKLLTYLGWRSAVPSLVLLRNDPAEQVRSAVMEALYTIRDRRGVIALLDMAKNDANENFRAGALVALSHLREEAAEAIPELLLLAMADSEPDRETDPTIISYAFDALGSIGKEAVPHLRKILADPRSSAIRLQRAVWSFVRMAGDFGSPHAAADALPDLLRLTAHGDGTVQQYAYWAIGELREYGRDAIPALEKACADLQGEERVWAASALTQISPASVIGIDALATAVDDESGEARRQALQRLAVLKAQAASAIPQLLRALGHKDWHTRRRAIDVLRAIGSDAAVALPALTLAAKTDPNVFVRKGSAWAIRTIESSKSDIKDQ